MKKVQGSDYEREFEMVEAGKGGKGGKTEVGRERGGKSSNRKGKEEDLQSALLDS